MTTLTMETLTVETKMDYFKLMGGKFQQHFDYFNVTVKNEQDLDKFYGLFDGNVVKSIYRFRQQKIRELDTTCEEFILAYDIDQIKALELLFQHTVHIYQLDLLDESRIDLVDLFYKFKETGKSLVGLIRNLDRKIT